MQVIFRKLKNKYFIDLADMYLICDQDCLHEIHSFADYHHSESLNITDYTKVLKNSYNSKYCDAKLISVRYPSLPLHFMFVCLLFLVWGI